MLSLEWTFFCVMQSRLFAQKILEFKLMASNKKRDPPLESIRKRCRNSRSCLYIYRIAFTTTIDAIRRVKARKEEQLSTSEDSTEESKEPGENPNNFTNGKRVEYEKAGEKKSKLLRFTIR